MAQKTIHKTTKKPVSRNTKQALDFEPTKVALLVSVVAVVSLTVFAVFSVA